jgi:hypothetical protein
VARGRSGTSCFCVWRHVGSNAVEPWQWQPSSDPVPSPPLVQPAMHNIPPHDCFGILVHMMVYVIFDDLGCNLAIQSVDFHKTEYTEIYCSSAARQSLGTGYPQQHTCPMFRQDHLALWWILGHSHRKLLDMPVKPRSRWQCKIVFRLWSYAPIVTCWVSSLCVKSLVLMFRSKSHDILEAMVLQEKWRVEAQKSDEP